MLLRRATCTCILIFETGVKIDQKRARILFKLAADQGHHIAQCNLAIMYSKGEGVNQSDTLCFKYEKLSADQGYADAQYNVSKATQEQCSCNRV